ncbi:hypothetical protein ACN2CC_03385 [Mesorhizobium muleiense]
MFHLLLSGDVRVVRTSRHGDKVIACTNEVELFGIAMPMGWTT